jgi:hypothetical protein
MLVINVEWGICAILEKIAAVWDRDLLRRVEALVVQPQTTWYTEGWL